MAVLMTYRNSRETIATLLEDNRGQDLVEYALLTAFIGLAGAAAFTLLASGMHTAYGNWDSGTQNLWVPPDPAGP